MNVRRVSIPTPQVGAVRQRGGRAAVASSAQSLGWAAVGWAALAAAAAVQSGCGGSGIDALRGSVTLDGQPLESGTLHLHPEDAERGPTAGGTVADGSFELIPPQPLPPGRYAAHLTATRRTGRMVRDPQRGEVPELVSLEVADTPQSVEVTAATAGSLQLQYVTRSR